MLGPGKGPDLDQELDKKFVVGGVVGGLFDYSVYSWPSFNQERNQAMVGPG